VRWLATLSFASGHFAVFWLHYILCGAECVCHKNNGQKCVHCHINKQCFPLKICSIFFPTKILVWNVSFFYLD